MVRGLHGATGLLSTKLSNGDYLIKGKYVTGFSWAEEVLAKHELRAGGRLATTTHSADEAALAVRGIRATNVDVFGTTSGLDDVARFIDAGEVTVPLEHTFPLAATADALAAMHAGHMRGKLVLTVA
jgi:NADPH:quinone reductase-like Zn-dependent oxidoreductase